MSKVLGIDGVAAEYPFSARTVRRWIKDSETNGFKKCYHKVGNKIVIFKDDLDEWIRGHNK